VVFALEQLRQRERWRQHQPRLEPHRLVFIDETWLKTNMAPAYGWSPKAHASSGAHRMVIGRR